MKTRRDGISPLILIILVVWVVVSVYTIVFKNSAPFKEPESPKGKFEELWELIVTNSLTEIPDTSEEQAACFRRIMDFGLHHCLRGEDSFIFYLTAVEMAFLHRQLDGNIEYLAVEPIGDDILYAKVNFFPHTVADDFFAKVIGYRDSFPKREALILDLRGNMGGSFVGTKAWAHLILRNPEDVVTTTIVRGGVENIIRARDVVSDLPIGALDYSIIVVLTGAFTASGSEVVAQLLRDERGALLVGEPTFGKDKIQTVFPLSNGDGLVLSTERYVVGNRRVSVKGGIPPDYYVVAPPRAFPAGAVLGMGAFRMIRLSRAETVDLENDTQLQKAVEVARHRLESVK